VSLSKAIRGATDDDGAAALAIATRWLAQEAAMRALVPALIDAFVQRKESSDPSSSDRRPSAKLLCNQLTDLDKTELARFRKGQLRAVTEASLSKFRTTGKAPRDVPIPLLFLIYLSIWLSKGSPPKDDDRISTLLSICNPLRTLERIFETREEPGPLLPPLRDPSRPVLKTDDHLSPAERHLEVENAVIRGLTTLLGLEVVAPTSIREEFFRENEKKAFFLLYRRARRLDRVIKGFLVIDAPATNGAEAYTFKHFQKNTHGDLRATSGYVFALKQGYYFLGGTSGGDAHEPIEGETAEAAVSRRAEAIKLVAVKKRANDDLWAGLFLSHDRAFDPIAGRCVLVRSRVAQYQDADIEDCSVAEIERHLKDFATQSVLDRAALKGRLADGIKKAINNAEEPGGDKHLAGPLTILASLWD
jgi:hypothetical protein